MILSRASQIGLFFLRNFLRPKTKKTQKIAQFSPSHVKRRAKFMKMKKPTIISRSDADRDSEKKRNYSYFAFSVEGFWTILASSKINIKFKFGGCYASIC